MDSPGRLPPPSPRPPAAMPFPTPRTPDVVIGSRERTASVPVWLASLRRVLRLLSEELTGTVLREIDALFPTTGCRSVRTNPRRTILESGGNGCGGTWFHSTQQSPRSRKADGGLQRPATRHRPTKEPVQVRRRRAPRPLGPNLDPPWWAYAKSDKAKGVSDEALGRHIAQHSVRPCHRRQSPHRRSVGRADPASPPALAHNGCEPVSPGWMRAGQSSASLKKRITPSSSLTGQLHPHETAA